MADRQKRIVTKVGMAVGAVLLAGVLSQAGQAAQAPKTEDVLPALLAEVKGLRAAMEQMASAGPRIQLFVSRLQLQEARRTTDQAPRDRRDNLASRQRDLESAQEGLKHFESALATATGIAREELLQVIPGRKREVAGHRATVARLTAEEAQLAADLTTEQGRWTDINQRLDELERALSKR